MLNVSKRKKYVIYNKARLNYIVDRKINKII